MQTFFFLYFQHLPLILTRSCADRLLYLSELSVKCMSALHMRPLCWDGGDVDGGVERNTMNNIPLIGISANITQVFGSNKCCSQYMAMGEDVSHVSSAFSDLILISY